MSVATPLETPAPEGEATAAPSSPGVLRRLLRDRPAQGALVVLAVLILAAIFGSLIFGSPTDIDPLAPLEAPSGAHLIGTDELGRDLLARTAVAGQVSLRVGVLATL